MVDQFELGTLVRSAAGRDLGSLYVVVGRQGTGVVLVADGRRRTINKPKRKNPKHLQPEPGTSLDSVMSSGGMLTDESIRNFLDQVAAQDHTPCGESRES